MSIETRTASLEASFDILGFSELMKPELTGLSVLTAVCAFYLASGSVIDVPRLFYTAIGTLLVGGAAGTMNQYLERNLDMLMKRTERRPLPAGRLSPVAALAFGVVLSFTGLLILLLETNALAFLAALTTLFSYLFVYTPLKRITPLNTVIGAVPGALPTLIGWFAARNEISFGGLLVFGMLFAWQMPHFLSLGWMYRKDYSRAGFKMLPVIDLDGERTGRQMLLYSLALVGISVVFWFVHLAGLFYLLGALVTGLVLLMPVFGFVWASGVNDENGDIRKNSMSRKIFFGSLVYLPIVLLLMTLDKL